MMSGVAPLHQFRFDQKTFWRNPASVFFTVAAAADLPADLRDDLRQRPHRGLGGQDHHLLRAGDPHPRGGLGDHAEPRDLADRGPRERVLKRGRGTPLPSRVFIAGRIGNSIVVSVLMLVVWRAAMGALVYGVEIPWERLPAVLVTLAVGRRRFCCLGFALTAAIPVEDAAPPSPTWPCCRSTSSRACSSPRTRSPTAFSTFADLFPIRHFFEAFFAAWDPATSGRLRVGHLGWSPPGGRSACAIASAPSAGRRGRWASLDLGLGCDPG